MVMSSQNWDGHSIPRGILAQIQLAEIRIRTLPTANHVNSGRAVGNSADTMKRYWLIVKSAGDNSLHAASVINFLAAWASCPLRVKRLKFEKCRGLILFVFTREQTAGRLHFRIGKLKPHG
jgi:hypothetical protein